MIHNKKSHEDRLIEQELQSLTAVHFTSEELIVLFSVARIALSYTSARPELVESINRKLKESLDASVSASVKRLIIAD